MSRSNSEPGLKAVASLLERMNAKRNPIKPQHLQRFVRHPRGPLLPDTCLNVTRLPFTFVPDEDGSEEEALAVAVAPDGAPCVLLAMHGDLYYAFGETTRKVDLKRSDGLLMFVLGDAQIIGFSPDGLPIISACTHGLAEDQREQTRDCQIYVGSSVQNLERDPMGNEPRITGAWCLSDGTLVTSHENRERKKHLLRIGDHELPLDRSVNAPGGPVRQENGEILRVRELESGIYLLMREVQLCSDAPSHYMLRILDGQVIDVTHDVPTAFVDVMNIDDRIVAVLDHEPKGVNIGFVTSWSKRPDGADYYLQTLPTKGNSSPDPISVSLGKNTYIGPCVCISPVVYAHRAYTSRDKYQCWIVNQTEQHGFDFVSDLHRVEDRYIYYGVDRNHLYKMDLPIQTSS